MDKRANQMARIQVFQAYFQDIVIRFRIDHDPDTSLRAFAHQVGCSQGAFWQWWSGRTVPDFMSCQKIARFFEKSLDEILQAAGLPFQAPPNTYRAFMTQVEQYQGWTSQAERDGYIADLALTLTLEWQRLDRKNKWRKNADDALLSVLDIPHKALLIADVVRFWQEEQPQPVATEDTPASRSPTGVHPAVAGKRKR